MSLSEYQRKRDFSQTKELPTNRAAPGGKSRFVIQKHAAPRLHYDFRLEIDGTLKSWAVPKGIPFKRGEKRLAVEVEDHPISYIDFEGTIPEGQYGGGTVLVWDQGTFEFSKDHPAQGHAKGKLHVTLKGKKLHGEWYLVRLREGQQWLLIKGGQDIKPVSKTADNNSALSGKTMGQLSRDGAVWQSNRSTGSKRPPRSSRLGRKTPASNVVKFVAPMLAKPVPSVPHGDWIYEIKFDGYRALILKNADQVELLSRNEKDLGAKFPEILEAANSIKADSAVIDGEIVAIDRKGRSSFQLLQAHAMGSERPPLLFYAFDLLELNGENHRQKPIEERKTILETLRPKKNKIQFSPTLGSDADALLPQIKKHELEGLIGKRANSKYESGLRTGTWVKLRISNEQEVVIGGYTDPEGARSGFGALLTGVYHNQKLLFSGKVGTGFNEKLLKLLKSKMDRLAIKDCPFANLPEKRHGRYGQGVTAAEMKRCHWVQPKLVCQVKFHEWTQDHKLRHPAFLGLREDKNAKAVVKE